MPADAARSAAPPAPAREGPGPQATVITLMVVTAALSLANGAVFALLAEFQDRYGFATWGLGLIAGSAFLSGLVANLALSRHADRGRARLLLVGGLLVGVVGNLWMGVATELWQFTGARLLLGLGFGAFVPAARKVAIHAVPHQAGRVLGRLASAVVGGFTLGPPFAAGVTALVGSRAPFLAIAAVVALTVPLVARIPSPPRQAPPDPRVLRHLARIPGVQAAVAVGAALYLSIGVFDAIWARYLTDLGASTLFVGLSLLAFGAPMALFAPLGGRLADRYGGRRVALIAVTASLPLMVLYGVVGSIVVLTAISALHAFCDGTSTPGAQLAVADASPAARAASAQGLFEAVGFGVAGVAALASASIYGAFGPTWLFGGSAAVMAGLLLVARWRGAVADRLADAAGSVAPAAGPSGSVAV
ncbi:MAG TPA: MFS transporter [Acidimicrobiales bacterium]|nr:MFS transporter [Acidimicrobiales bacterium]